MTIIQIINTANSATTTQYRLAVRSLSHSWSVTVHEDTRRMPHSICNSLVSGRGD